MRVRGNVYPESVTVETYLPTPGMVEIRLRENVKEVSVTDEMTDTTTIIYEYDEYMKVVPNSPGLREDITANLSDWLVTLRSLEVDGNASILRASRDENEELLSDLAAMVDAVYESDLERIES